MIYCGKAEFGQISRSCSLNSGAIRLKIPKNLTQIGFPSLRSVKSDRLLGAGWNLGRLNTREFAVELSKRMDRSPEAIVKHITERCNHIQFFQKTYAFFRARCLPQAIVTVNPDIFSNVIVPICDIENDCDAIVTSWEEGTIDKNILNRLAIERMNLSCENAQAILIDNKRSNIDHWVGVGGVGYLYTDDATFVGDTASSATLQPCLHHQRVES